MILSMLIYALRKLKVWSSHVYNYINVYWYAICLKNEIIPKDNNINKGKYMLGTSIKFSSIIHTKSTMIE